ncbi:F-box protein: endocytic membrane traffic, recycling ReCYcling 1 [Ceratobasidium sp. UAMH 11750]|nr:F-box protein: endocytic membrane traffic, recycling ReCYcling 1 [Ceratobasidium sp. UAMH 11750]
MDQWQTLEPVKLHGPQGKSRLPAVNRRTFIGPFPPEVHVRILAYLPIHSLPFCARVSRAFSRLVRDDRVWKQKYAALGVDVYDLDPAIDVLDDVTEHHNTAQANAAAAVPAEEDDFGDFASAPLSPPMPTAAQPRLMVSEFGDFVVAGGAKSSEAIPAPPATSSYAQYLRVHRALTPLLPALLASPHLVLPTLFPESAAPLSRLIQSKILHLLARFLSPAIQPTLNWPNARRALFATLDRFDGALLGAFDAADGQGDEAGMRDCAAASWEAWVALGEEGRVGNEWEMGRTWAEKREVFYEHGKWDATANITPNNTLDFSPMDKFMPHILDFMSVHGALATRVFPPASRVLPAFAERLATDVIGEYITPLLSRAREVGTGLYLQAAAASFVQAWRLVDATRKAGGENDKVITKNQAEDIIFRMFEEHMDEYLDEEVEVAKIAFDGICKDWERKLDAQTTRSIASAASPSTQARFLASHNPAQVKRNVLSSFTSVLLLPVTIVPRVGEQIGSAAVTGFGMLNPQRWTTAGSTRVGGNNGYRTPAMEKDADGGLLFEVQEEEDEKRGMGGRGDDEFGEMQGEPWGNEKRKSEVPSIRSRPVSFSATPSRKSVSATTNRSSVISINTTSAPTAAFDDLDLLLSLDTALELIHADREALKRCETFKEYPAPFGHRVRETIEELFILMLQAMGDRHIAPGFARAAEQMRTYQPAEHAETTSVAPLLQFFELAHIGDTIQSVIQVYFDKELAPFIDKTDFLNAVVREKKRFENALDDAVAGGLNAGTEVLMNQVEHIIITRTGPRVYYPDKDVPLELGPTKGCQEAIACLEMHCKLLKGSTSKEVLEVFYQEVGIRLHAILQKHLKRQIISLEGGFQVIADLNAYHAFIVSLKVPSIQQDFANLKMLGHVYVVEDAVDLAQIVRDATRYGGSFRPEDVYEFIQRRSDWKKIEKTVDKTMYNLSFKEDCVIC